MKIAIAVLVVGVVTASASAQTGLGGRVPGGSIGEAFHLVAGTQVTQHTVTLRFGPDDNRPDFTVEFVTRVADHQPASPGVVDVIITEVHPADESPAMAVQIDGETQSVSARLKARRSIATTMAFDAFAKMIAANTIIYRAFGSELEFSPGQMRMLRATVERWMGP